jgi:hypothetical protein
MSKTKISGRALTVISTLPLAVIATLGKYEPQALTLLDSELNPEFVMAKGTAPSLNKNGVVFNDVTADGKACATISIPDSVPAAGKAAYVVEEFGPSLYKLDLVEEQAQTSYEALQDRLAGVAQNIEEV